MFFHASKIPDLSVLKPRVSNHGIPLVYLSEKRENVLVYLSNAVEKHCRETGFNHTGIYKTWGSYGFTKEGIFQLEEYYPNATVDTYKGESGYIYSVADLISYRDQTDIPYAVITEEEAVVTDCEYVSDAYDVIMEAVENGKIVLQKYDENSQSTMDWIKETIKTEYQNAEKLPDYRSFLKAKFEFL